MKKQMKYMIFILLLILVILIVSLIIVRISKGYKIYGNDYCNTAHHFEVGGDAFTDWTCNLCGKTATNPDTNVPEICDICSILTGRCNKCGKLTDN